MSDVRPLHFARYVTEWLTGKTSPYYGSSMYLSADNIYCFFKKDTDWHVDLAETGQLSQTAIKAFVASGLSDTSFQRRIDAVNAVEQFVAMQAQSA